LRNREQDMREQEKKERAIRASWQPKRDPRLEAQGLRLRRKTKLLGWVKRLLRLDCHYPVLRKDNRRPMWEWEGDES